MKVDLRHHRKEQKSPQHEPSIPFWSRPFPLTHISTTGQKKAMIPQADSGWTSWAVAQTLLLVVHLKQMKLCKRKCILTDLFSYIAIGTQTYANHVFATITAWEFSVGPFALLSRWLNDFPLEDCSKSLEQLIILQENKFYYVIFWIHFELFSLEVYWFLKVQNGKYTLWFQENVCFINTWIGRHFFK